MNFDVIFTEVAEQHISDALEYYKSLSSDQVSFNFLKDIESAVSTLEENPYFQIWTENFRAIPMSKFPYLIFFDVDDVVHQVKIMAVFHTAQDPTKYP